MVCWDRYTLSHRLKGILLLEPVHLLDVCHGTINGYGVCHSGRHGQIAQKCGCGPLAAFPKENGRNCQDCVQDKRIGEENSTKEKRDEADEDCQRHPDCWLATAAK